MAIVYAIDGVVLSFFTKISHWFQRLTGRTNFFLARICFTVFAMVICLDIMGFWFPVSIRKVDLLGIFISIACILSLYFTILSCERADNSVINGDEAIKKNNIIKTSASFRVVVLVMLLMDLIPVESTSANIGSEGVPMFLRFFSEMFWPSYFSGFYFAAVVPLPPGKSRIAQWADGFRAYFAKTISASSGSAGK